MGMFQSEAADNFCINEEFIHTYLEDIIVDRSKVGCWLGIISFRSSERFTF